MSKYDEKNTIKDDKVEREEADHELHVHQLVYLEENSKVGDISNDN